MAEINFLFGEKLHFRFANVPEIKNTPRLWDAIESPFSLIHLRSFVFILPNTVSNVTSLTEHLTIARCISNPLKT